MNMKSQPAKYANMGAKEATTTTFAAIGLSNREIAGLMGISVETVKEQTKRGRMKLDVDYRGEILIVAVRALYQIHKGHVGQGMPVLNTMLDRAQKAWRERTVYHTDIAYFGMFWQDITAHLRGEESHDGKACMADQTHGS